MTSDEEENRPSYKEILECIDENKDSGLKTYIDYRENNSNVIGNLSTSRMKK